jgi:predicted ArsR family transcriptional regulator
MKKTKKSSAVPPAAPARTRRALLELLKWEGPVDASALARRLDLTPMAVRLQLYALAEEKLVESEEERRPKGRPAKLWRLTPAADELFPNRHADLTLSLIGSVRETFGEKGLTRLISARSREQLEAYRAEVPRGGSLRRRLEALARIRTREGYMAEVTKGPDGSFLLVENHCPICVAAAACTNLCAGELWVFRELLGGGVQVERTDHILAGARRCAYRVTEE